MPQYREVLSLHEPESVSKIVPQADSQNLKEQMIALTADLEAQIARLRENLSTNEKAISNQHLEKLKDIRNDLQAIAPE